MKVIIWGHELHSHTHSYIHAAFYKAFKFLGYDAYWFSNKNYPSLEFDFNDSLFLTEGQVDANMPKLASCKYILHNCDAKKYQEVPAKNILNLQVYTNACLQHKPQILGDGSFYLPGCLFQPWATDLLPHEINLDWVNIPKKPIINWIGTIGSGKFGNIDEIEEFQRACKQNNIKFELHHNKSFEENLKLVQESYLAPAIEGTWQVEQGYIACRIFKNMSYGCLGLTNCKEAYELLDCLPVYNKDCYELFIDGMKGTENIVHGMKFVRDNHTYINRIKTIMELI